MKQNKHFFFSISQFHFLNSHQKVHLQTLTLKSTLHFALEIEAFDGDFPFGTVTLIPSQMTLIPTFGVFKPPILAFTLVSSFIFNSNPFLFFKATLNSPADESSSSWLPPLMVAFKRVLFLVPCTKGPNEPFAITTSFLVVRDMAIGS